MRMNSNRNRFRTPVSNTHIMVWLGIAAVVAMADQITKMVIEKAMTVGQRVHVMPGIDLTLLHNRGAAFSFLSGATGWQRWFFTAIAMAAVVFIVVLLARHGTQRLFAFALALVLGGAVGNVIDRLVHAQVTDFILVYWRDWYWPAFNLADSAISLGAMLLVLDELRRVRRTG